MLIAESHRVKEQNVCAWKTTLEIKKSSGARTIIEGILQFLNKWNSQFRPRWQDQNIDRLDFLRINIASSVQSNTSDILDICNPYEHLTFASGGCSQTSRIGTASNVKHISK